jgi:hypothetical protein
MWAATTSRAAAGMTVNDFSTRTQPIHAASRGSVRAMLFGVAVVGSLGSDRDRQVSSVRMPFTLITRGLILIP